MQRDPFKHHRFPPDAILRAVRWHFRFALSCRDVRDMLAERGFESLSSAKDALRGIEAVRAIKHGRIHGMEPGAAGEIRFASSLLGLAA